MGDTCSEDRCLISCQGDEEAISVASVNSTAALFQRWLNVCATSRAEFARLLHDRAGEGGWTREELDSCLTWLNYAESAPIPHRVIDAVLEQITATVREMHALNRQLSQMHQAGSDLVRAACREHARATPPVIGMIPAQRSPHQPQPANGRSSTTAPALTPREREILQLLGTGQSNRQISRRLGVAERTVKNHLSSLFSKLDATDRTTAVLAALRRGLITITPQSPRGAS